MLITWNMWPGNHPWYSSLTIHFIHVMPQIVKILSLFHVFWVRISVLKGHILNSRNDRQWQNVLTWLGKIHFSECTKPKQFFPVLDKFLVCLELDLAFSCRTYVQHQWQILVAPLLPKTKVSERFKHPNLEQITSGF